MSELTKDLVLGIVSGLLGGALAGIIAGISGMSIFSLVLLTLALTGAVYLIIRLLIIVWTSK